MSWEWVKSAKRYRNQDTGRFMSTSQMRGLRDTFLEKQSEYATELSSQLAKGDITAQEWEAAMRERIKAIFIDEYALGAGGRNALDYADYGRLGAMIKEQYQYLHLMMGQVLRGELSERMIAYRSGNFFQSAYRAFQRAIAAAYGIELPTYPRDGTQICKHNCRCEWIIKETSTHINATWDANDDDGICDTCENNALIYNPLRFQKVTTGANVIPIDRRLIA